MKKLAILMVVAGVFLTGCNLPLPSQLYRSTRSYVRDGQEYVASYVEKDRIYIHDQHVGDDAILAHEYGHWFAINIDLTEGPGTLFPRGFCTADPKGCWAANENSMVGEAFAQCTAKHFLGREPEIKEYPSCTDKQLAWTADYYRWADAYLANKQIKVIK